MQGGGRAEIGQSCACGTNIVGGTTTGAGQGQRSQLRAGVRTSLLVSDKGTGVQQGDEGGLTLRCSLVCVLALSLIGGASCASNDSAGEKALVQFEENNLGIRFSHSPELTTSYNPHGGADRVMIAWRGKPLGGLMVLRHPPAGSIEEFISSGKDYYRSKYGASSVDYSLYTNPNEYKFHRFEVKTTLRGTDLVLWRYVYLRAPEQEPSAGFSVEKVFEKLFGAFSFEFACLESDYESVKPEIDTVIDTFRISDPLNQ